MYKFTVSDDNEVNSDCYTSSGLKPSYTLIEKMKDIKRLTDKNDFSSVYKRELCSKCGKMGSLSYSSYNSGVIVPIVASVILAVNMFYYKPHHLLPFFALWAVYMISSLFKGEPVDKAEDKIVIDFNGFFNLIGSNSERKVAVDTINDKYIRFYKEIDYECRCPRCSGKALGKYRAFYPVAYNSQKQANIDDFISRSQLALQDKILEVCEKAVNRIKSGHIKMNVVCEKCGSLSLLNITNLKSFRFREFAERHEVYSLACITIICTIYIIECYVFQVDSFSVPYILFTAICLGLFFIADLIRTIFSKNVTTKIKPNLPTITNISEILNDLESTPEETIEKISPEQSNEEIIPSSKNVQTELIERKELSPEEEELMSLLLIHKREKIGTTYSLSNKLSLGEWYCPECGEWNVRFAERCSCGWQFNRREINRFYNKIGRSSGMPLTANETKRRDYLAAKYSFDIAAYAPLENKKKLSRFYTDGGWYCPYCGNSNYRIKMCKSCGKDFNVTEVSKLMNALIKKL